MVPPEAPRHLKRGNGLPLTVEMVLDCVGDADTADDQGGQAGERHEEVQPLDEAFGPRRRIGAAAQPPSRIREGLLDVFREPFDAVRRRLLLRQLEPVAPAHQTARPDQFGSGQGGFRS